MSVRLLRRLVEVARFETGEALEALRLRADLLDPRNAYVVLVDPP